MTTRLALSLPPMLAIAACAPAEEDKGGAGPSPFLPGYELAVARDVPSPDAAAPQSRVVDLSVDELAQRIATSDILLVDVRTPEEVADGMIPGALHMPLDTFDPAAPELSDGREVVLYCRSGRRSSIAANRLAEHTGKPAEHLAGGMLAWEKAGEPVVKP